MLRKTFGVKRDAKFPLMTYAQLRYAYERIFQEYNSVPYLEDGTELAPMDFLKPYNRLHEVKVLVGTSKGFEVMNHINGTIKLAMKIRWDMIVADGKYEMKLHPTKKANPTLSELKKGDIC